VLPIVGCVRRAAIPILVVALFAAGCGARSNKLFTAKGTIACLKTKGFIVTTDPAQVGFIAAFAEHGGAKATTPTGNVVTIAFTKDETTVKDTANAFKAHASKQLRPHFSDVLRTNRNVVMVWTTTPASDDDQKVEGCLAP
jgi:hypothetical protein